MNSIEVGREFRQLDFGGPASVVDPEKRLVRLTGSSELPVERYDWSNDEIYDEVLSHDPEDVDFSRMADGGPVLDRHRGDQIAVIEKCWINEDGKSEFLIRFSAATERARTIFADVVDGIRRNVSVGYQKTEIVNSIRQANGRRLVKFRWQPFELSFEPVPADPTVGVGRSAAEDCRRKLVFPEPDKCPVKMIIEVHPVH